MKQKIIGVTISIMIALLSLTMIVSANSPPTTPTIEGPSEGTTNTPYDFNLCSTDPDGDDISYCIDWGDGVGEVCIGPVPSGACLTEDHTWTSQSTYTITVKAQDTQGAESDTAIHSITLPKNKGFYQISLLFEALLQRFVFLESMYLHLLQ